MRSERCGTAREHTDPPADARRHAPRPFQASLKCRCCDQTPNAPRAAHSPCPAARSAPCGGGRRGAGHARLRPARGERPGGGRPELAGSAGVALLMIYALAGAVCVARLARRPSPAAQPASLARLWLVGSAGVTAVCGGQALLADALHSGAVLGGGWAVLLVLCVLAGGLIALALRVAPAAAALLRSLRPSALRPRAAAAVSLAAPAPSVRRPTALL